MRSVTNAYDKARSACEVRCIIDAFLQLRFIAMSLKFQSGSHFLSDAPGVHATLPRREVAWYYCDDNWEPMLDVRYHIWRVLGASESDRMEIQYLHPTIYRG